MKSVAAVGIALQDPSFRGAGDMRDLAAYLSLTLTGIHETVEQTATAWEKREYWVKADKFRLEWGWVNRLAGRVSDLIQTSAWEEFAAIGEEIRAKTADIQPSKKLFESKPWRGAWEAYRISGKN